MMTSDSGSSATPIKENNLQKRRSVFLVGGVVYLFVGVVLFTSYHFALAPLMDARVDYERARSTHSFLVKARDVMSHMNAEASEANLSGNRIMAQTLLLELSRVLGGNVLDFETDFDKVIKEAHAIARQDGEKNRPSKGETSSDDVSPERSVVNVQIEPTDRQTFEAYLKLSEEDLGTSSLTWPFLGFQSGRLSLLILFIFASSVGLIAGGLRLLMLQRRPDINELDARHFLLPLLVPVLAIMLLTLLTGFGGSLLDDPIDDATSQLLVMLTGAIGLAPENFMQSVRGYLKSTVEEFTRGEDDAIEAT